MLLSVDRCFPLFVDGWPLLRDGGMESSLPVGHVVHDPYAAVGFHQAILAFNHITITLLPRALDVSRVRVVHAVLIGVARVVFL